MKIGTLEVGGANPCRVISEISCNHGGSIDRAVRLIDASKAAGADAVKFQCYTPDELVALRGGGPAPAPWGEQGWTMRTLYEKAQTPHEWFVHLVKHCERIEMPWFSSVFGLESLALLESLGCPVYKIARLDCGKSALIEAVQQTGKPVIVSTRGDTEIDRAAFRLYCPPGYPTRVEDVCLPWQFRDEHFLGLSSHCLDPRLPIAAVARGAKLLEYHVQLAEEPSELEANISLNEYQLNQMVADVRATEALCGV